MPDIVPLAQDLRAASPDMSTVTSSACAPLPRPLSDAEFVQGVLAPLPW